LGVALVAVAVDTVAVTYRQAPWAGLPMLLLYSIPATTVKEGLSPLAFVPAAIGYVVLLVSEGRDRLGRWGRVIGFGDNLAGQQEGVQTSLLGQTGRRVGVAVIGLAVVVPALLPALPEGVIGTGTGSGSGGSGRTIRVNNPMLDLRRNLTVQSNFPVFTYTTSRPNQDYIRLVVLDEFDGENWRTGERRPVQPLPANGELPDPQGLDPSVQRQRIETRFEVLPSLDSDWLPLLYSPKKLEVRGNWSYDATTLDVLARGEGNGTAGLTYVETSIRPEYTSEELKAAPIAPGAIRTRYTQLPDSVPESVKRLAEQLTENAENDWERAYELQQYFRNEFTYSTDVEPGHGGSALIEFLEDKRGYCEQFSATMAIMARSLGMPARVVVGYQEGTSRAQNQYEVKVKDAHAWPEIYFSGFGWVRFEPTPSGWAGPAPSWALPERTAVPIPTDLPSTAPTQAPIDRARPTRAPDGGTQELGGPTGGDGGGMNLLPFAIAAGVLVILAIPGVVRVAIRRHRLAQRSPRDLAEACWREIADTVTDLGSTWDEAATPRAAGTRLSGRLPVGVSAAVQRIVSAVERTRYAPLPDAGHADVRAATLEILRALRARTSHQRRLLATILPTTFWRPLTAIGRPITWLLDGIDEWGGHIAGRLRFRRAGG
ncbi:MAG TPA: DUF3488 and transglutaminase-like domain-containing protein, partial [Actinopolymorphaceae bacterium]